MPPIARKPSPSPRASSSRSAPSAGGGRRKPARRAEAEAGVSALLSFLGEDPDREGLRDTPARVVRAFEESCRGYREDPAALLRRTFSETEGYDEIVLLTGVRFFSQCEHHLLPIVGRAHVGYLPDRRIVGISKLARIVEIFASRLQVQEKLTVQIASTLHETLQPRGVGVVIEATHHCMSGRGVRKPGVVMKTSTMLGSFRTAPSTRAEFLSLIARDGGGRSDS